MSKLSLNNMVNSAASTPVPVAAPASQKIPRKVVITMNNYPRPAIPNRVVLTVAGRLPANHNPAARRAAARNNAAPRQQRLTVNMFRHRFLPNPVGFTTEQQTRQSLHRIFRQRGSDAIGRTRLQQRRQFLQQLFDRREEAIAACLHDELEGEIRRFEEDVAVYRNAVILFRAAMAVEEEGGSMAAAIYIDSDSESSDEEEDEDDVVRAS